MQQNSVIRKKSFQEEQMYLGINWSYMACSVLHIFLAGPHRLARGLRQLGVMEVNIWMCAWLLDELHSRCLFQPGRQCCRCQSIYPSFNQSRLNTVSDRNLQHEQDERTAPTPYTTLQHSHTAGSAHAVTMNESHISQHYVQAEGESLQFDFACKQHGSCLCLAIYENLRSHKF